ncbi:hypothetical protein KVT40_009237 [Elsinoe batatas]|uniref:Uncharacterized protein n=1 Tax=Elsinoe batatas TaxID=2601811 RepID=A0A8K0P921_9PEZI|nr:hypothetical protein KVT40_009237 [Elsinoe batatas]
MHEQISTTAENEEQQIDSSVSDASLMSLAKRSLTKRSPKKTSPVKHLAEIPTSAASPNAQAHAWPDLIIRSRADFLHTLLVHARKNHRVDVAIMGSPHLWLASRVGDRKPQARQSCHLTPCFSSHHSALAPLTWFSTILHETSRIT